MEKALVIWAGRNKGNTYEATRTALEALGVKGVRWIHTADLDLPLCRGCMACILRGESHCPHAAVTLPLRRQMDEASLIVLASPVYSLAVSAPLKNVIDHFSYLFHRPAMTGKAFLAVATTAGAGAGGTARYMASTARWWGAENVARLAIAVRAMSVDMTGHAPAVRKAAARLTARRPARPPWANVLRFGVFKGGALGQGAGPDYEYWREKGWLDAPYYRETPPMPLRAAFGRMLASATAASYRPGK